MTSLSLIAAIVRRIGQACLACTGVLGVLLGLIEDAPVSWALAWAGLAGTGLAGFFGARRIR